MKILIENMIVRKKILQRYSLLIPVCMTLAFYGCSNKDNNSSVSDATQVQQQPQQQESGRQALRFETFGNEGFWTDAVKLPQGIVANNVTPVQALQLGLSVNLQALDADTIAAVAAEIAAQGTSGPILNDPATTIKLINANAVIGVVVKDTNRDGKLDVASGDKVGVSCVLCHAITDGSALNVTGGGSIGAEIDGPAVHNIQVGKIFSIAQNTKALYPMAQLKGVDGTSIGRAAEGLTKNSTEAEFDAYFGNPTTYPVGMFDDTADGNGNPMHNTPLFRQDLAAPFGSAGELATFQQFGNTVFTVLLDPTNLLSPGGRAFLHKVAGANGDKLAADYQEVLAMTGVTNYPFTTISRYGEPATPDTLIGIGVDLDTLNKMTAYVNSLHSPLGIKVDTASIDRGRDIFTATSSQCLTCHNASQAEAVRPDIIPMAVIFPGDNPDVLAQRDPPLSPVLNTPGNTFDDKMIVINASLRGLVRGSALPLLMDLARKPVFLHDNSVGFLEGLFDPGRGAIAPHPFYISNSADRDDLATYLRSLDDTSTI